MASKGKHACTATCMFRCLEPTKLIHMNPINLSVFKVIWRSGCHER